MEWYGFEPLSPDSLRRKSLPTPPYTSRKRMARSPYQKTEDPCDDRENNKRRHCHIQIRIQHCIQGTYRIRRQFCRGCLGHFLGVQRTLSPAGEDRKTPRQDSEPDKRWNNHHQIRVHKTRKGRDVRSDKCSSGSLGHIFVLIFPLFGFDLCIRILHFQNHAKASLYTDHNTPTKIPALAHSVRI